MKLKLVGIGFATFALLAGTSALAIALQQTPAAPLAPVAQAAVAQDDDGDGEIAVALADLPAAVRTALAGITADAAVTQVAKEMKNGAMTYDIEYTKDGKQWAVEFSDTGAVLENELDDDSDENGND